MLKEHFLDVYWILIVPMTLIVLVLEFFKEAPPAPEKVLKRFFIATLLLLSFDTVSQSVWNLGEYLSRKIGGISTLDDLASLLGNHIQNIDIGWFGIRKSFIYILGMSSYFFAYIGVFTAKAVTQFAWAILTVCSPLMIMAYISDKTAMVTGSLYRGMINVSLWKIMGAILGVLLLEFAKTPSYNEENLLTVIIINLCIASSLLMVPFTVKSLLGDGLTNVSSMAAALPGVILTGALKRKTLRLGKTGMAEIGNLTHKKFQRGPSRRAMHNNQRPRKKVTSKVKPKVTSKKKGTKKGIKKTSSSNVVFVDFKNKRRKDEKDKNDEDS